MMDVEQKVIAHDEQIKTLFERQKKLETVINKIDKLTISIEKMAVVQSDLIEEQKELKDDVSKIKYQPADDARHYKRTIISCIITTIIGALLGAMLSLLIIR